MKKLFRTMLPAVVLLAGAMAVDAQYSSRATEPDKASSAELQARTNPTGFVAPRAKSGNSGAITSALNSTGPIHLDMKGRNAAARAYIDYIPDIKGMDFGEAGTTLQTIGADGSLSPVGGVSLSSNMGIPGGGYGHDGVYCFSIQYAYPYMNIFYTFAYDTETWQMLPGWPRQGSQRFMSTDLTYDVTDGKIYGCFTNDTGDGYEFGTVDFEEGERNTICSLPSAWNAIAADKAGVIYAIDMEGALLKVDKTNGSYEKIGDTGYVPRNVSSATFDHKTGKLYWTVSTDSEGFLCEVDTATGQAAKIADFPNSEEMYALYVMPPAAEDRAPAAPSNLSLDFTDASLSGHLLFDAPSSLFRGEDAEGPVNYRIMSGSETLATGTTTYGAKGVASPEFSVPAPGHYKFSLICYNDEGDSPKAETERFIGADAPAGVRDAKAEYANGIFTVSWNAPTESANGGYINPAEINYTVTRMPDNETVAENTKETSIADHVAIPESFVKYHYAIKAEYAGCPSVTVNTNGVGLGNILPPFTEDFSDAAYTESYTAIDGNGDGRGWGAFVGMAQCLGPIYGSEDSHADDWLLTPAVKFEKGKFYKLSIDAATMGSSWKESFEVAIGSEPTVEAMTDIVIPAVEVCTESFMAPSRFEEYFSVPETGIYYIGIHHNTPSGAYILLCDNLSISEPVDAMSPGAVSDLSIVPAADGEKKVSVTFKAPETDLQGNPLPFLDKVEIMLDGALLHEVSPVSPGATVSLELDIPTSGLHKFTVTAWNGDIFGRPVEIEVHVGLNVPVAPEAVEARPGSSPGTVTVSWNKVSTDIDGKAIPDSEISYLVVRLVDGTQQAVAGNIKETSLTYTALPDAGASQEFFQYAVFAHAEAGYSNGNVSNMIAVGAPDVLPWKESFANGMLEHIMAANPLDGTNGAWMNFGDQSFSMGVKSYDSDNGMIGMNGPSVGDKARLFTGRIDFTGLEHPTLSFYTFNLQSAESGIIDSNEISIMADNGDGQGFRNVQTLVVNDIAGGVRGWAKATVDLSSYAGQTVQLAFDAETKSYLYTLIDLMEITDRKETDLAVISSYAPSTADLDTEFEVKAEIENMGRRDIDSYKVALYNNDVLVKEIECGQLASGSRSDVSITHILNASCEESNKLYVEVQLPSDQNSENNRGDNLNVRLRHNDFPQVRSLTATGAAGSPVTLDWEAPLIDSGESSRVTETFEDAETDNVFPTEYGNWTLLDCDKGYIGGLKGVELPGIQTGSQQGFWVMDANHPVFNGNTSYAANSGSKYLAQMYTMNLQSTAAVPCDDWIISPWLNEKAQTVEFYARSYGNEDTSERFQFLYSKSGTKTEDFVHVGTVSSVPHAWTKYSFDVPDGARYFAIRCTSIFEFMLFIDDITYTPANGSNLELAGYNVYVDGIRDNETPVTSTSYSYAGEKANDMGTRYSVSAVYTRGESKAVHTHVGDAGTNIIESDSSVTAGKGNILIKADNADITIWSIDGIETARCVVNGVKEIPVPTGVYMVRCNNRTEKVFVR